MLSSVVEHADLAELHGATPQEPLPILWPHFVDNVRQNEERTAIVSLHQDNDLMCKNNRVTEPSRLAWTYGELYFRVEGLAAQLYSLGVHKGTTIATVIDNRAEWVLLFWAAVRLDAIFMPFNPRYVGSPIEFRHCLKLSQPGVLVVLDKDTAAQVETVAAEEFAAIPNRFLLTDDPGYSSPHGWKPFASLLGTNLGSARPPTAVNDHDQPALILFTSGTTSLPKACLLSYDNIAAPAVTHQKYRHVGKTDRFLQQLPGFHVYGIFISLAFWLAGASIVYPSRSFDAASSLFAIQHEGCTHMAAVPSMVSALLGQDQISAGSIDSLQSIDLAGTIVHPELVRKCRELGVPHVSASYGMTEGSGIIAIDNADLPLNLDTLSNSLSVGGPTPRAKVRICQPGSRTVLKRNTIGELHFGGPAVIKRYLGLSSEDLYEDGGDRWIVSGDTALMDEKRRLFILGRYKDLIIRGGENISPARIESCLDQIQGVTVVGVADEVAGELPVAVLQKTRDVSLSKSDIQQHVARELGQSFTPQHILDLSKDLHQDDFPKTVSAKIKKNILKDMVEVYLAKKAEEATMKMKASSTLETLVSIWARITGQEAGDISISTSLHDLMDSISMMRYVYLVGKEIGKSFGVDDVTNHQSLEAQAGLLDARPLKLVANGSTSFSKNFAPLGLDGLFHCNDSPETADRTRKEVEQTLEPAGLAWDDVEDIIPMGDYQGLYVRKHRLRSWNHRQAYVTAGADVRQLRRAVEACLRNHPLLRTMAVNSNGKRPLYVVMKPNSNWHKIAIGEGFEVDKPEELRTLRKDTDYVAYPGPLFRMMLVNIKGTGTAGIVYYGNHSVFDALSISLWLEDLDAALHSENALPAPHADFRVFARRYHDFRASISARESCAFHHDRLRGISRCRQALWPPRRAPQWFKGNDEGWVHTNGSPGNREERKSLNGSNGLGVRGINGSVMLPSLAQMKKAYGIPAQIVMKAALALLNIHCTRQRQAIFSEPEAGREWPPSSYSEEEDLPNPMDIPGPTLEIVLNRIFVDPEEDLQSFLRSLQGQQQELLKHARAPIREIEALLAAEEDLPGDALNDDIIRRQGFNWLPSTNTQFRYGNIRQIQVDSWSDLGLRWNCIQVDAQTVAVNASFDDAQLRAAEVEKAVDELLEAARWVADTENLERKLGDCPLFQKDCQHVMSDENGDAVEVDR